MRMIKLSYFVVLLFLALPFLNSAAAPITYTCTATGLTYKEDETREPPFPSLI
jgi:hypothetical protein